MKGKNKTYLHLIEKDADDAPSQGNSNQNKIKKEDQHADNDAMS